MDELLKDFLEHSQWHNNSGVDIVRCEHNGHFVETYYTEEFHDGTHHESISVWDVLAFVNSKLKV